MQCLTNIWGAKKFVRQWKGGGFMPPPFFRSDDHVDVVFCDDLLDQVDPCEITHWVFL